MYSVDGCMLGKGCIGDSPPPNMLPSTLYMHVPRTHGMLGGVRCTGHMCTRYMHVQC